MLKIESVKPSTGLQTDVSPKAIDKQGNRLIVNPVISALNTRYSSSESGFILESVRGNIKISNAALPAGNNEIGVTIEAITTDVTSTSEDFDLIFKTMAAGSAASERLKLNVNGATITGKLYLAALNTAPSSAADTGTAGEIRIDANHIYVCTATDTWKRIAIATW